MANFDRVFFAERHGDLTPLKTLAQPETLEAMFCAGHTKIAAELFHIGQNPIFEAYFKGEISDWNLENYILNQPTNYQDDLGIDDQPTLQLYFEIIKNARDQGIQFYGLGTLTGSMDQEIAIPALKENGAIDLKLLKRLEELDFFSSLPQKAKENLIADISQTMGLDKDKTEILLIKFAGTEPPVIDFIDDSQTLVDRLNADPSKAELIDEIAGDGKMTSIYGGLHLWRITGDIDHTLGDKNTAVITILEDTKVFWQDFLPAARRAIKEIGIDTNFENLGNYQFDAKTNTWYDGANDTNTVVDIPEGMKQKAGEITSPAFQNNNNYEIEF